MRRFLIACAFLVVATASLAASPYFLDRCGVLWKGSSTDDGLLLTGEVDGQVVVSSLVPFVVGLNGNEDTQIQVAADELTGKVTVVWQRTFAEGFSEIYLAVWSAGGWERITPLTGVLGESPRFPLITLSTAQTTVPDPSHPEDPQATTTLRDSFVNVVWWQGAGEEQHAAYALLRLTDSPEDPEALQLVDLDALIPVGIGCPAQVPTGVLEHPLFAANGSRDRALIFYGSKRMCLFHLAEVAFELEPDTTGVQVDRPIQVQRRRHTPIFGVRKAYQAPESFNMDSARMVLGADLRPVGYRVVDGHIQYVVASEQGWSPVRVLTVRDGLSLDQAIPLIENLAR